MSDQWTTSQNLVPTLPTIHLGHSVTSMEAVYQITCSFLGATKRFIFVFIHMLKYSPRPENWRGYPLREWIWNENEDTGHERVFVWCLINTRGKFPHESVVVTYLEKNVDFWLIPTQGMCQEFLRVVVWTRLTPISPQPIHTPFGLRWRLTGGWPFTLPSVYLELGCLEIAEACSSLNPGRARMRAWKSTSEKGPWGNSSGNFVSKAWSRSSVNGWGKLILVLSVLAEFPQAAHFSEI